MSDDLCPLCGAYWWCEHKPPEDPRLRAVEPHETWKALRGDEKPALPVRSWDDYQQAADDLQGASVRPLMRQGVAGDSVGWSAAHVHMVSDMLDEMIQTLRPVIDAMESMARDLLGSARASGFLPPQEDAPANKSARRGQRPSTLAPWQGEQWRKRGRK